MHSNCENIEFMINDQADELIEKPFQSRYSRFRILLETSMMGSDFVFVILSVFIYCIANNVEQI